MLTVRPRVLYTPSTLSSVSRASPAPTSIFSVFDDIFRISLLDLSQK